MNYENCKECSGTCRQYDRQNEKEHDAFYPKGKNQESEYSCIIGKHRRTPNNWKKSKNKETTDEQVRGKPEDLPAAAKSVRCPIRPQPMRVCRQEGGRPATKEKYRSQEGEYSRMTCKHRRTPNTWKESKNKETTDEQVPGKPGDQPTAAEGVCWPICPQPIGICRQIDGKPDTKEPTDEQVRGKLEDQPVAAERVHCPR